MVSHLSVSLVSSSSSNIDALPVTSSSFDADANLGQCRRRKKRQSSATPMQIPHLPHFPFLTLMYISHRFASSSSLSLIFRSISLKQTTILLVSTTITITHPRCHCLPLSQITFLLIVFMSFMHVLSRAIIFRQ